MLQRIDKLITDQQFNLLLDFESTQCPRNIYRVEEVKMHLRYSKIFVFSTFILPFQHLKHANHDSSIRRETI